MGMGSSVRPAVRHPQEKQGTAIGRPQRGKYLGLGTSVRPANGAHRRNWGQPSGAHRGMIESEGGYLREASRQAPTGEGAASQRRQQKTETSMGPAIRRPQERCGQPSRRPQDIVRPAITALTVWSANSAHKCGLPLLRSQ